MNDILANLPTRPTPQVMLVASRALAASRPSLIALLISQGAEFSSGIDHPISFCNVLFVGNLCAALVVGFWFGFNNIIGDLKTLSPKVLLGLLLNGLLATALAALIFLGLQSTSVTNAVLLGRLGPVLFALAGTLLLGKRIRRMEWVGFSLIGIGVVAITLLTNGFQIGQGDVLILLSTVVYAIAALVNKLMIARAATVRSVVFSRNLLSAVFFFIIAMKLFGPGHFSDTFSGDLWILMSIYALIVIVFAQFLWYASFEHLDSRTIGRLTVLSPVFGVTYAFLINGERPSTIQVVTLVVVILGVLIASLGRPKRRGVDTEVMHEPDNSASAP
ncbi:MAG: DMT family transporter [Elainellaceae cyanobacterium]